LAWKINRYQSVNEHFGRIYQKATFAFVLIVSWR